MPVEELLERGANRCTLSLLDWDRDQSGQQAVEPRRREPAPDGNWTITHGEVQRPGDSDLIAHAPQRANGWSRAQSSRSR